MFNFYADIERVEFTSVKRRRNELSPFHVIHLLFNLNYLINLIYIYLILNLIKISMYLGKFIQLIRIHKSIWNVSD